jgi:antirestriction protein ArdC
LTSSRARNYQRRGQPAGNGHKPDVYQSVTDRMVAALESGKVPWRQPWTAGGRPRSMTTRQPYKGINTLLLGLTSMERGYASPWWGTANQINAQGGHIRKGQSAANGCGATWITLWKTYEPRNAEPDPETGEVKEYVVARLIPLFNAEQCEGLPERFYPARRRPDRTRAGGRARCLPGRRQRSRDPARRAR